MAYEVEVEDCALVEKAVHQKLSDKRVRKYREFFHIPLKEAIQLLDEVAEEFQGNLFIFETVQLIAMLRHP